VSGRKEGRKDVEGRKDMNGRKEGRKESKVQSLVVRKAGGGKEGRTWKEGRI
jgi:hypothetical protein